MEPVNPYAAFVTVESAQTVQTLDEIIWRTTMGRFQFFMGDRKRTAKSLGVSLRILQIWLNKWCKEGKIQKIHLKLYRILQ